jgi:hypothetical protein
VECENSGSIDEWSCRHAGRGRATGDAQGPSQPGLPASGSPSLAHGYAVNPEAVTPNTAGAAMHPASGTSVLRLETGSIICFVGQDGRLMGTPDAEGGGGNWPLEPQSAISVAIGHSKRVQSVPVSSVFVVTRAVRCRN